LSKISFKKNKTRRQEGKYMEKKTKEVTMCEKEGLTLHCEKNWEKLERKTLKGKKQRGYYLQTGERGKLTLNERGAASGMGDWDDEV